jgi:hypothetical protein
MHKFAIFCLLAAFLSACSSPAAKEVAKEPPPARTNRSKSSNPAMKYIELVGFRINEKGPGNLQIRFGVANHSEADLGDLTLDVHLRTTTAKPEDAPLCSFTAKVSIGPEDLKDVTVLVPTKLRVYELPDWQFLTADYQIAEPK